MLITAESSLGLIQRIDSILCGGCLREGEKKIKKINLDRGIVIEVDEKLKPRTQ